MKNESNAARAAHAQNEEPSQRGSSGPPERSYGGPERRRHRVFVTRNTEYHFRDGFCIAVRDRRTGGFLQGHLALHRRVQGGLKFFLNGGISPNAGDPRPGESLYFSSDGRDLVTSPLESIERPKRELVEAYPSRRKAVSAPACSA